MSSGESLLTTSVPKRRRCVCPASALKEAAPGYDIRYIINALNNVNWLTNKDHGKNSKKVKVGAQSISLYWVLPGEENE